MLRVPTRSARAGMRLALDVRHPLTGRRLLSRGYCLDRHLVAKLAELHVHEVWVEYPQLEEIRRFVSPEVVRRHGSVVSLMAHLFDRLHANASANLDFAPYKTSLARLIESLARNDDAAIYLVELGGGSANALRHASEVCFLSLLLGLRLGDYLAQERPRLDARQAGNVVPLGLGALLHDVGLELIGDEARRRFLETGDESDPELRDHVWRGYKLVTGRVPASAATAVLHHHQAWDGSGFPTRDTGGSAEGLAGHQIHVFARIVAVAETFDRLRHRPDGTVLPRVVVLQRMLASRLARRFDPVVLRALPTVVPAYPPGTLVRLSDGSRAVVTDWDPDHPCQPRVRLVREHGPRAEEPIEGVVDLRFRTDLVIAEQDGWDVSKRNFRLREAWSRGGVIRA